MAIYLVPDPTYRGKGDGPLMIRADAMRKLFKAGESVVDIALRYGVSYHLAYKMINPPRKRGGRSTTPKALTQSRLTQLTLKQLKAIAEKPGKLNEEEKTRALAAGAELDRRGASWGE